MGSCALILVLAVGSATALPTVPTQSRPQRFVNASCASEPCSAFDVGVSIGKLHKENIVKMFQVRVKFYRGTGDKHNLDKLAAWPKYANMSLPTLAKYAPTTLAEMRGVAVGAELPLTTILQLATDYENGLWLSGVNGQPVDETTMPTKACTAFGFTDSPSGRAFCGQNNDEKHSEFLNGTLDAVIARPAVASPHGVAVTTITYSHPGMPAVSHVLPYHLLRSTYTHERPTTAPVHGHQWCRAVGPVDSNCIQ